MAKIKLSSPWMTLYHKLNALFGRDPEISILFDEEEKLITLRVDNAHKADALSKLLPQEFVYGNVVVKINVIPANDTESIGELFRAAFEKNPVLERVQPVTGIFSNPIYYVVFAREVVQFFNDDLSDVRGQHTTLYQDLAKDIFGEPDGTFFCTDSTDSYDDF